MQLDAWVNSIALLQITGMRIYSHWFDIWHLATWVLASTTTTWFSFFPFSSWVAGMEGEKQNLAPDFFFVPSVTVNLCCSYSQVILELLYFGLFFN